MDHRIFAFLSNKWNDFGFSIYLLAAVLLLGAGCAAGDGPAQRPPNILLIMTDDQGWGDLHVHGNDSIHTPVLDSLARSSVRLQRFYVSPVCAPTRASLLTGRYHLRTGTSFVTARRETMRSEEVTLAEVLYRQGYRTGIFGKWHNGEHYPNDPLGQGFETFFGFSAGHWNNYFNTTLTDGRREVATTGYITDVLTDRARAFMTRHRDQPFFCYVPYNAPHGPFQVPDAYFDRYKALSLTDKNAAVYGMVENVDDNVGRLLETLDSLQLKENTIVIFLTDNGPNGERYNGGMRGWKASVHEGGSRVPCFISWPGTLLPDREIPEPAAHIDLMPTLLDLAGIPLPEGPALDGQSLAPLLRGQEIAWPDRALYTVHSNWDPGRFAGAVRTTQYRMVVEWNGKTQLYDMQQDPAQTTDLAEVLPGVADSLRRAFDDWLAAVRADGLQPPPIAVGHPEAPLVFLPAPEATLQGQLRFRGSGWANDWITGWAAGDLVSWPLQVETAGRYALTLHYNYSAHDQRPEFHIALGDQSLTTEVPEPFTGDEVPSPDRIPRGEVYEKAWGRWPIPPLALQPGTTALELKLLPGTPAESFELKGVEIRRVEE